jgi:4-amino-4-deoxy-L-arabinose transferase-like glycosyltransferase
MQLTKGISKLVVRSWPITLVFVTSILITLLFWRSLPGELKINESGDYTYFYEPVARNLLGGHGFTLMNDTPAIDYPPGHSVMLAGLFKLSSILNIPTDAALSIYILISMALTSMFVFVLAQSLWGSLAALVSSLVWITYPLALWLTKQPNSEISFMVVFYGGFCLFWNLVRHQSRAWPMYFFTGLLAGLAMLIRPIAIGIVFVMAGILWLLRREASARLRVFPILMMLLGNFITLLPWEAWVYFRTGRAVPLSSRGLPSVLDGLTFAVDTERSKRHRRSIKVPQDVAALMQDIRESSVAIGSRDRGISVIAGKLLSQPLPAAKLFAIKAVRSWYGTDSGRFETPIILIQGIYLVVILWCSWAAWKRESLAKESVIGIWLIVLYFWGMTVLALSIVRYMVPVMGLLFVLLPAPFVNRPG